MYGSTSVLGASIAAGTLPATGFGIVGYVVTASVLIFGGLLLVRFGRRNALRT